MKGIVLAGGTGSRLWPITKVTSKQLLPVYDKPMIFYPIATLMLAGVKEILIITTPDDSSTFMRLLGDGSELGIRFQFTTQEKPEGLAQALTIGADFLDGDSCLLILGDNLFYGNGLGQELSSLLPHPGARIFTYEVAKPEDYGVLEVDGRGEPLSVVEKPTQFISNLAITGLYFFDSNAVAIASEILPSQRGELEITSVIQRYIDKKSLSVTRLSRGTAWLDTGTFDSLLDAGDFIRLIEKRSGLKIANLEEIAFQNKWISPDQMRYLIKKMNNKDNKSYLERILLEADSQ